MSCQWRSTEGYNTGPSIALVRHQNLARNCCEIDWVFASTNCVGVSQCVVVMHTVVTVCWMLGSTNVAWVVVFFSTIWLINCLQTAWVCSNPSKNIQVMLLATGVAFTRNFRPQPFNKLWNNCVNLLIHKILDNCHHTPHNFKTCPPAFDTCFSGVFAHNQTHFLL